MGKTAATTAPLHPLLAERWSPQAVDPSHAVSDRQATALLEAARWAPSANNSQPWRFLVALACRSPTSCCRPTTLLRCN